MEAVKTIEIESYKNQWASFYIRPNLDGDKRIVEDVWSNNPYLRRGYDLSPGDLVIDIGAHIGSFTVLAALQGAGVIAFEPHQENYDLLLRNVALNKVKKNVKAHRSAVSVKAGTGKLWLAKSTGGHGLYERGERSSPIDVPLTTLDSILGGVEKCDLLKMDCEGAEFELLLKSDLSKVSKISMEWHGDRAATFGLVQHLTELGFAVTYLVARVPTQGLLQARRMP